MAEPLKHRFGTEVPEWIAARIVEIYPPFDREGFLARSLDGYEGLELTPRARHVNESLAAYLPTERDEALQIITEVAITNAPPERGGGMGGFVYLPFVYFVADHGLDHFDEAMAAQYELTRRFTAEFSIRAFLIRYPAPTLERLAEWAGDADADVRRLVSEGTRPRLPWAPRLPEFQADPTPVLALLERLKDDPEDHVRRSVANNLNDISKDHPALAAEVGCRWWADGNETRRRLVRHGLRTLVKQGDPDALAVLGYVADTALRVDAVEIDPARVAIGDKVRVHVTVANDRQEPARALVDLRVHFVKKAGSTTAKVFKGAELEVAATATGTVRKTISVAQHSTRTHYPGRHRVEIMLNGVAHDGGAFELV